MTGRGQRGRTLVAVVQGLAAFGLLATLAAGALAPAAAARSAEAGARALAARLRALSARAVAERREVALVFPRGADEPLREARDGADDGVTRAGVEGGADPAGLAWRLARDVTGVRIGRPAWPSVPDLPPGGGTLAPDDPAVRFGGARLVVFDAEGHATPGSLFVTDGRDALCGVVVSGATARVRVWCFDRGRGAWVRRM